MRHKPLTQFISTCLIGIFLFAAGVPPAHGAETVYYYHNDHLGSPLAMTNDQGNVVWRRDYKPFGEEIDPGGATTSNTHTYTGKEFDSETGLYYYGARYYDPTIGRFISVDPVGGKPGMPQTWNRYVYTLNNPYKYVDPDGRLVIGAQSKYRQFSTLRGSLQGIAEKGQGSMPVTSLFNASRMSFTSEDVKHFEKRNINFRTHEDSMTFNSAGTAGSISGPIKGLRQSIFPIVASGGISVSEDIGGRLAQENGTLFLRDISGFSIDLEIFKTIKIRGISVQNIAVSDSVVELDIGKGQGNIFMDFASPDKRVDLYHKDIKTNFPKK